MRAIVRDRYGPPSVLELRDVDQPKVGDDTVLVRVRASSLNSSDLEYLYGRPLIVRLGTGLRRPARRGMGVDVAGRVEAVGRNVTQLRPGDEVFGDMTQHGLGAFAEYVCAPAKAFALKPATMGFEEAATIPQSAVIALQGLQHQRQIRPGDRVLINGAGGSVGPFAIQIAKSHGAEVTGVDSTAKLDLLRSVGADHAIDYTRDDFLSAGQRYDLVLDLVARRSMTGATTRAWISSFTVATSSWSKGFHHHMRPSRRLSARETSGPANAACTSRPESPPTMT